MTQSVLLDGTDWEVKGFLGVDAAVYAASHGPFERGGRGWLPARVPGSVVDDLWRAGEVPDPYVGRNSLAIEWVAERSWLYRRAVAIPELPAGGSAVLRFEGVDHGAQVYVDGQEVAGHEGMFTPFEVPLDPARGGATSTLGVLVEPAPTSEPQVGRTSRVRVHKSRMSYGWDFCPRMVHQGIWQSVRLDIRGPAWIVDARARPSMDDDLASGAVDVEVTLGGATGGRLDAALHEGDRLVATGGAEIRNGAASVRLDVDRPRPWWPIGLGEAVVHRLVLRLHARDGALVDERTVPVGFRRVELRPNDGAPTDARGYTLTVNGRRTPIRGWNWTPLDVLHGVPRGDRLDHLVRLARQARVNLLRVWGGGLIETEAFYTACDEAGILVWQEFSQSSSGAESTPAADAAFVDRMHAEAEAIVPLRRNHPSLAVWCGGNELEGPDGPLDDDHPVLGALREVVARLDPDRAWLPTSPSGPRFHNRLDVIEADPDLLHDVHGPWEHQGLEGQHTLWNRGTALLNSEFGVEGMAGRRQLEAIVPAPDRWPATRDNPVYRHLGDWWINEPLVQAAFGERLTDLELLHRASRHLQAEGLRYAVESNRRRWPRNAGSLPWQLNESYPNAWCTAAVDHRGDPKPAYFGVARAYEEVHVAAEVDRGAWSGAAAFRARIWAWTDGPRLDGLTVRAAVVDLQGQAITACEEPVTTLDPDRPTQCFEIAASPVPDGLFLLDLSVDRDAAAIARNRYLFTGAAQFGGLLDLAAATIRVERGPGSGEDSGRDSNHWWLELAHLAGPAAIGVVIEDARPYDAPGWAAPSDSGFDLLPGERRRVDVRWASAPADGRRLRVDAWNVAVQHVD